MSWSISIGSISGIRIRIHMTFLLFLIWIGVSFWQEGGASAAVNGLAYILLLFLCVVMHEFGHILTARRFGSETQDVILLPIGGVARMKSIPEKPGQELAVALAGPAVNLMIALILVALIGWQSIVESIAHPMAEARIFSLLAVANLFLALFNLLPAFPMDGGRALRALLSYGQGRAKATNLAMRVGHTLALGLGAFGFLYGLPLLILIAVFIYFGATTENQSTQLHQLARRMTVSDAMITQFSTLPVDSRVSDAVEVLIHSSQHDIPIVDGLGRMMGLLTRSQILHALHDKGDQVPVSDVMQSNIPSLDERSCLEDALRLIDEEQVPAVSIADTHGRMVGMVTLENLGQMMVLERQRPNAIT